MAQRYVFFSQKGINEKVYEEKLQDFTYYSGFAVSQKQKSIRSLHKAARIQDSRIKILEVSTKSEVTLGTRLSAFNLKLEDSITQAQYCLENVFQSSKVFENGGPYEDLLEIDPKDAKRDPRLKNSGSLKHFLWKGERFDLEPKSMFYDWIYCSALSQHPDLVKQLIDEGYNAFTDIEFNHHKSFNCQARSVAIFVSLISMGRLDEYLQDKERWRSIYPNGDFRKKEEEYTEQMKLSF